jgi:hypothetical protein
MPDFITKHRVPILEVGTFPLSTGETTFTLDDLTAIVASQDDPHVPSARLKIGHWYEGPEGEPPNLVTFAEEPVFGTLTNYDLDEMTLYADIAGVPSWFDQIWETAFPNRSVEGLFNFKANSGKTYSLVLSALSLLGVSMPGVSTLPDLAALYTTEDVPDGVVLANYKGGKPVPRLDAAVSVEQLRRDFYDNVAAGDQLWWWVREVQLEPQQIICDSDDGDLYRIPYTLAGDSIEWGDPQQVKIVYEDVAVAADAADTNGKAVIFATAAESRPNDRQRENEMPETKARRPSKNKDAKAAGTVAEPKPGTTDTDPEDEANPDDDDAVLDDGDDDAGAEKPGDGKGPDDPSQPAKTTLVVPEGMSLVPTAVLEDLKSGVAAGREARKVQLDRHRDTKIAAAIDKGKFAPAQRENFEKLWAADAKGTEDLIDALEENVIPIDQRSVGGAAEEQAIAASASYPGSWLTESEAAVVAARNGKGQ